jgi:hypothetical protein
MADRVLPDGSQPTSDKVHAFNPLTPAPRARLAIDRKSR